MKIARALPVACLLTLISVPVWAQAPVSQTTYYQSPVQKPVATDPYMQPDLLSFGVGWFDVTENTPRAEALDVRAEYRWGVSLLSKASSSLSHWDRYVQLHPMAGIETSSRGQLYGFGGIGLDVMVFQNLILTPSEAFGLYGHGNGKDLGSMAEFRSQIELAYRFGNEARTSVYYSHISNAGIGDKDPGANTVGIYLHVPTRVFFGFVNAR